jgi:hypothetical protein
MTNSKNNIVSGQSSKKAHLKNPLGRGTVCKVNTLDSNPEEHFIWIAKNHPEHCCSKCVQYLQQRGKL